MDDLTLEEFGIAEDRMHEIFDAFPPSMSQQQTAVKRKTHYFTNSTRIWKAVYADY